MCGTVTVTRVSPELSRLEIIQRADVAGNVPTVIVFKSLVARADYLAEMMAFFASGAVTGASSTDTKR